jgi:deoxyhypusine synthase
MVDVIVASAGGIEEDFIKCMAPTFMGDFELKGSKLREDGINRIGNMLVPNDNYCLFEEWITPILNQMLKEQNEVTLVYLILYILKIRKRLTGHHQSLLLVSERKSTIKNQFIIGHGRFLLVLLVFLFFFNDYSSLLRTTSQCSIPPSLMVPSEI